MAKLFTALTQMKSAWYEKQGHQSFRLEYPYDFYLHVKEDERFLQYQTELLQEEIAWMQLIPARQPEIRTAAQLPSLVEAHRHTLLDVIERNADACKHIFAHRKQFQRTAQKCLNTYLTAWIALEQEIARCDPHGIQAPSYEVALRRK